MPARWECVNLQRQQTFDLQRTNGRCERRKRAQGILALRETLEACSVVLDGPAGWKCVTERAAFD